MLRKLIKHELRATGRTMGPMLLLVLVAAVGGNLSTRRMMETDNDLLSALGVALLTAFVIAIAAVCVVSFALMVERFYRNLLRDEGYLTMTLPVSVHEHIWAKLMTTLIWWAAVCLVVAAGMLILVFSGSMVTEVRQILVQLKIADLNLSQNLPHLVLFCAEGVLMLLVGGACMCLHFYAALAVGCSFAHHKEALSVAGFFVLPAIWSILEKLFSLVLRLLPLEGVMLWAQGLPQAAQVHLMMLGVTAVTAIPAVLYYAVTAYFLKNRLNLG